MHSNIKNYLDDTNNTLLNVNFDILIKISELLKNTISSTNRSIYVCGNGGSAYCASHFVTDLAKTVNIDLKKKIRIYSLVDNIGIITAYSNDISYSEAFKQQLINYSKKGDIFFAISGSGQSENVVNAARYAKKNEIDVISFTGFNGGKLKNLSDYNYHIPSNNMQIVEDLHVQAIHILTLIINNKL